MIDDIPLADMPKIAIDHASYHRMCTQFLRRER